MKMVRKKIFFTIIVLLSTVASKATITVTSVDSILETFYNMSYALDLDNDGVADYSIEAYHFGPINNFETHIDIKMLSSNSEIVSLPVWPSTTFHSVDPMDYGDVFHHYFSSKTTYIYDYVDYTNLHNTNNKYVALRLLKGGNYYYGWIHFSVSFNGHFISLIDYAYENAPNRLITAGQTVSPPVSVATVNNENTFSVYPNPVQNTLTIKPLKEGRSNTIKLYNSNGVLVRNIKQQAYQIDVSDLASGIYFVELIADNKRTVKKIIKN